MRRLNWLDIGAIALGSALGLTGAALLLIGWALAIPHPPNIGLP